MLSLAACGGSGGGTSTDVVADVAPDVFVPATFGVACTADDDCATGLCLHSEIAPFGWCTRDCAAEEVGSYCPSEAGEVAGLCLSFPDAAGDPLGVGFRSERDIRRFCAPICLRESDCAALDSRFLCVRPEWRGDPLFSDRADHICRGEEQLPGPIVDPRTCDWEGQGERFPEAAVVCRGYCDYLDGCKLRPDELTVACCEWRCFARMTQGDRVDPTYRDELTCYIDYFQAFRDTALVCSEPPSACGDPPPLPPPAP